MSEYVNDNGKIITKEDWRLSPDNRSFRYGDGCFETIKVINSHIILVDYHFERLFSSLEVLKFDNANNLNAKDLTEQILELCSKNDHLSHGRVRLTFYRGDGGLYDELNHKPNYLIQSSLLSDDINRLNEKGLIVDFYPEAIKANDTFSNLKTNNFLPYTMAAIWAKENQLNDAILLNALGNIADATIANIFIVRDGTVYSPSLIDGPVNGVMRRYILKCLREEGIPVHEISITDEDVLQASEVFFTNAVYGIRWIKQFANINYTNQLSTYLHNKYIQRLFTTTF